MPPTTFVSNARRNSSKVLFLYGSACLHQRSVIDEDVDFPVLLFIAAAASSDISVICQVDRCK